MVWTRGLKFLFVNFKGAALRVGVRNVTTGEEISPFTLKESVSITNDTTRTQVHWQGEGRDGLAAIAGQPVQLEFQFSGSLFSFWLAKTSCGESRGYTAGGGPGLDGDVDSWGGCPAFKTDDSEDPPAQPSATHPIATPALVVAPARKPFLSTDKQGSLLVAVAPGTSTGDSLQVSCVAHELTMEQLQLEIAGHSQTQPSRSVQLASASSVHAGARTELPFDLSLLGLNTTWEVLCTMPNKSQPITARTLVQYVPDRPGAVVVDGLTRGLVRDGSPFIVSGFFGSAADDQMLEREAQNAWTALFTSDPTVFQSRAEAVGIGVVLGLASVVEFMEAWPAPRGGADAMYTALEAQVRSVRDESALLMYNTLDEPSQAFVGDRFGHNNSAVGQVSALSVQVARHSYLLLKLLDPYKPVLVDLWGMQFYMQNLPNKHIGPPAMHDRGATLPNGFDAYLDYGDVWSTDPYIIGQVGTDFGNSSLDIPLDTISAVTAHVAGELLGGVKPLHLIIQAFGGRSAWLRPAQPRELRVMSYLALAHGATGVYFFSSRGSAPMTEPGASPWRQASELATELFGIGPSLLSPSPTATPTVVAKPIGTKQPSSVRVRAFADEQLTVVVAINRDGAAACSLDVTGLHTAPQAVATQWGGPELPIDGGHLRDVLEPYAVHVYRILSHHATEDVAETSLGNLVVNPSFEAQSVLGVADGYGINVLGPPGQKPAQNGHGGRVLPDPHPHRGAFSLQLRTTDESAAVGIAPLA